jgi:hypothetical protein
MTSLSSACVKKIIVDDEGMMVPADVTIIQSTVFLIFLFFLFGEESCKAAKTFTVYKYVQYVATQRALEPTASTFDKVQVQVILLHCTTVFDYSHFFVSLLAC